MLNAPVAVHKKAYDEGRKSAPTAFNPNFDKHMKKVVQRDQNLRREHQKQTKITMV